ncbi:MAG: hypothetical protein ACJAUD_001801, partial [Crocinitomicaceae bacterium]
ERLENFIAQPQTPVNRAYRIKMKNDEPEDGKHYIEIVTNKNRCKTLEVLYEDGWAIAESTYFGTYSLKRDEVAPVITSVSVSQSSTSTSKTSLIWKISDAQSGIEDYDLFIDGKWYLLKYDYKARTITFERPSDLEGKKELVLKVKDSCGNVKEWTTEINFL